MRTSGERLKQMILELGSIGKTAEGGVTRRAFTNEDIQGRNYISTHLQELGCSIRVDAAGNLIGRWPGTDETLPAIVAGSHTDTVPNGGLFDGTIGVLSGIECIRTLQENGIRLKHPFEIISFSAEEGSALGGTFGSRAMAGQIHLDALTDQQRLIMNGNLQAFGLDLDNLYSAKRNPKTMKAFLEVHVEQGGILEQKNVPIGIVYGIVGIYRYEVIIQGEANHSGSTPMDKRDDALVKAAKIILAVQDYVREESADMVGTVGSIQVKPNAINVIPGEVRMTVEFRDINAWDPILVYERLRHFSETLGGVSFKKIVEKEPVRLHPGIQQKIKEACEKYDIEYNIMPSAAGHDAVAMSYLTPTAMIFVPSHGGISHSPDEWTDWDDITHGADVLLQTIVSIDQDPQE